jgi:hypothetical protein
MDAEEFLKTWGHEGAVYNVEAGTVTLSVKYLEEALRFALAEEREACAVEMDRRAAENANTTETHAAYRNAARAIRARTAE